MSLRLRVLGADSVLESSLCAHCPHSPAGCCVAPPRYDWSDLARVVGHGHLDWLLSQIREGTLRPVEHGLAIQRVKRRLHDGLGAPRLAKCTFHAGDRGCTIDPAQRPATCNFYLCESALEHAAKSELGAVDAARARAVHDDLVARFTRWDAALHAAVQERWPSESRYSEEALRWLAAALESVRGAD